MSTQDATADNSRAWLAEVLRDLAEIVDGVEQEQLSAPTPCTFYDVATLRDHVVQWLTAFAEGYADSGGQTPDAGTIAVGDDPGGQVRSAAETLDRAVADGAAQRDLKIGDQAMPGGMALQMILWEYQVHGWDIAKATGQQWSPADDGLEASLTFAPNMLTPDFQGEGKAFAPRVPVADDAPAMDRLVGLSGRRPDWTPA